MTPLKGDLEPAGREEELSGHVGTPQAKRRDLRVSSPSPSIRSLTGAPIQYL